MTNYKEAEPVVLDGELLDADDTSGLTPQQQRMQHARNQRAPSKKTPKKNQRINVTKIMREHGYCPVTTQILMAQNRWEELGLQKPVTAHEMNSSSQCLLHLSVPSYKPIDFVNDEEIIKNIPVFTGRRDITLIEAPSFVDEDVEDDDN